MAPKGKAKKPLSAKAKAKLRLQKQAEKEELQRKIDAGEIEPPKPKSMGAAFKRKILKQMGDKSVAEAKDEIKAKSEVCHKELHELEADAEAKAKTVETLKADYDKAKAAVAAATEAEIAAANAHKETMGKRADVAKKVMEARTKLYEYQRKVAMMEVLAVNAQKMKQLDAARKAAQQAAEEAKKNMLEQKQREKEAMEATRKAIAEQRAAMRPAKAQKTEAAVHPDLADTVAADID